MKCTFNNGELYKTYERYICGGCIFKSSDYINICRKINLCDSNSILKRSRYQSDIFKL